MGDALRSRVVPASTGNVTSFQRPMMRPNAFPWPQPELSTPSPRCRVPHTDEGNIVRPRWRGGIQASSRPRFRGFALREATAPGTTSAPIGAMCQCSAELDLATTDALITQQSHNAPSPITSCVLKKITRESLRFVTHVTCAAASWARERHEHLYDSPSSAPDGRSSC